MIGLARLAAPIACGGLLIFLLARTRTNRIAGLCYAGVGVALLGVALKPVGYPKLVVAGVGALALGWAISELFRRRPWAVAYLSLALIPVRISVIGHSLLVPLYLVAAGAGVNLLRELIAGDVRGREFGRATKPFALYLFWIGLSMTWTLDVRTGIINLVAFYIPLAILAVSIARLPWDEFRLKLLYWELAVMALVFSVVGLYQYETRTLFENPKLHISNSYASLFRVNSVFYDPSIYGRFLVVALIPTAVLITRAKSVRDVLLGVALAVVAWFGLLVSFSQSSFAALFVAAFCLGAFVWRWKAAAVIVIAVVLLAVGALAEPRLMHTLRHHGVSEIDKLSSGRGSLIFNGLRLAKRHPVIGVGIGSFAEAYSHLKHRSINHSASHNTPVTVAAEGGVIGLALFLWLVIAFGLAALRRVGPTLAGELALAAGLVLIAIFFHSNAYNDFFEDPTTWIVFGLIGLSVTRRRAEASAMIEP
jgi:O-antigen ligase